MVGVCFFVVVCCLVVLIDGIYLCMGLGGEELNVNIVVMMVLELLEFE